MNLLYEELATLMRAPSSTRNHPVWKSNRKQAVFFFFFCYELVLDSIDKSDILLISCLAPLRSPSTHENLIKFLHMIIISYPGTTLSNAHELTLSSLLQINVWRASVDGAPILKLGDSSVYLVFFSLQRYICVYISNSMWSNCMNWFFLRELNYFFFVKNILILDEKTRIEDFFIEWNPNYKQFLQDRTKIVLYDWRVIIFFLFEFQDTIISQLS